MTKVACDYSEDLQNIKAMLDPNFDWDKHYESGGASFFEIMEKRTPFRIGDNPRLYECGSFRATDTPKSLYRALWLFKPKSVDFSDMYKSELFCVVSPDKRFLVQFYLFKYELGLYFFCDKKSLDGKGSPILMGAPGYSNGWNCTDPTGILFFETIKQLIETTHEVYGGNNFAV